MWFETILTYVFSSTILQASFSFFFLKIKMTTEISVKIPRSTSNIVRNKCGKFTR